MEMLETEFRDKKSYCLTVGILSWNRKDALEVALKSIQRQTLFNQIETIVVDSNSFDGSPEYVLDNFPWVRLIKLGFNPGLAGGRNILVNLAQSSIVFWMDDDCELMETDGLEKMLNFMFKNSKVGVLYAKILEGDDDAYFFHLSIPQDLDRKEFGNKCLMTSTFASGGTLIRKDLFVICGGYDEEFFRMNVENDLSYRIYDHGYCICYYPLTTIVHRPHKSGRNNDLITYYSLRNKLWGYWKNLPFVWAVVCSLIEFPMGFLRSLKTHTVLSWSKAMIDSFKALPRRKKIRTAISKRGLALCTISSHYIIEWQGDIPDISEYSLLEFILMEMKTRVLSRMGLWKRDKTDAMLK